jgi:hypothetical protein
VYLDGGAHAGRVLAADATPLRELRERYLSDSRINPLRYDQAGIPVTDGTLIARVFMRDALPYENDEGLLPLPGQ